MKKILGRIYRYILTNTVGRLETYRNEKRNREVSCSWGKDNADKCFYIIGIDFKMAGIFAIAKTVLSHIMYAEDHGYIPVVDLRNYRNQFLTLTKGNPWEMFFTQPTEWDLEKIACSKNIIKSRNNQFISRDYECSIYSLNNPNNEIFLKQRALYKKYFHFSSQVEQYVQEQYKRIIGNKKCVLGVLCRGTDYTQKKPKYHPVQPSPQMVIEKIYEIQQTRQCDYIYLATEDETILNIFRHEFEDKLLYMPQKRFGYLANANFISELNMDSQSRFILNMQYLASLYILSKCNYLIGGRTSGSIGAYLMSDGFEYSYFWDLGLYQ